VFGGNLVVPSEDPKLFARFALSSASTAAIAIRVKEGSRIVGQVTGIQANGAVVSLSELVCSIQKPDRGGLVVHELKWEALIGNGGWSQIAATTHRIFWTESAVFANDQAPLYDLALEKASAYINHPQTGASGPSLGAIALSICRGLEREVYYNPKIVEPQQQSEMLRIYSMVSGVQCTGHAKLMQTLVQAMGHTGLDVAVLYVWGGVGGTGKRMVLFDKEVGFYKDLGVSFGCSRPAEDDARNNPFFVFHALIVAGGVVYDPTYGLVGEPALVEFAPPDRDLSPLGNFPGTEDKDHNSDGIFDVPQRMSGDFEAFFPAWEARKYFYLR